MPKLSPLDKSLQLLFFPTLAHQPTPTSWQIPIHGYICKPAELSHLRRAALHLVKHLLRLPIKRSDPNMPLLKKRLGAFLAKSQPHRRIQIQLNNLPYTLKKSHANGHFKSTLTLPASQLPSPTPTWLPFHSLTPIPTPGKTLLLPPTGLSVISDIDDTIKITDVLNRKKMLANTFLTAFTPVPGMSAFYQHLAKTQNAAFHYISASPWQLYPFLEEFLTAQNFPAGSFHLKNFRLKGRNLPQSLLSPAHTKSRHIRQLLKTFPLRTFILIGDSGQSDPTTYANFAQSHPTQIQKIYIRDITSDPPNSPRWQKTFAAIDPKKFQIFTHASELFPS